MGSDILAGAMYVVDNPSDHSILSFIAVPSYQVSRATTAPSHTHTLNHTSLIHTPNLKPHGVNKLLEAFNLATVCPCRKLNEFVVSKTVVEKKYFVDVRIGKI